MWYAGEGPVVRPRPCRRRPRIPRGEIRRRRRGPRPLLQVAVAGASAGAEAEAEVAVADVAELPLAREAALGERRIFWILEKIVSRRRRRRHYWGLRGGGGWGREVGGGRGVAAEEGENPHCRKWLLRRVDSLLL